MKGEANTSAPPPKDKPYAVLARKYRPSTFDDLIGQDVMVRTLRNAFAMNRIAQAYMLTGVRGVGKTTTARILARALNYTLASGQDRPSLDMPELGLQCEAIIESRHVDVMEMDAASHTGIDDIREILETIRYAPAYARYRVFIIDEVHMLSKPAFNGLLKTLEEPPPHVKFIFATTEIRKVPATVLSRCQRFDLKRVDHDVLVQHFAKIVQQEGFEADEDALALVARSAEGSVRDGLSILDQALALSPGKLRAADVQSLLGLANREQIFTLLAAVMHGDAPAAFNRLQSVYEAGGDPASVLADMADAIHALSRLKIVPDAYPPGFLHSDRENASKMASRLAIPALSQAWQMLLKGIEETAQASRPLAAAEMVLIRLCYSAGLPAPYDLLKANGTEKDKGVDPTATLAPAVQAPSVSVNAGPELETAFSVTQDTPPLQSYADVTNLAGQMRDIKLKVALEEHVSLVEFKPGHIALYPLEGAQKTLAQDLSRKLQTWTGERWVVSLASSPGQPPLAQTRRLEEDRAKEEARRHPAVQAVFHHFPGAQITRVKPLEANEAGGTRDGKRRKP